MTWIVGQSIPLRTPTIGGVARKFASHGGLRPLRSDLNFGTRRTSGVEISTIRKPDVFRGGLIRLHQRPFRVFEEYIICDNLAIQACDWSADTNFKSTCGEDGFTARRTSAHKNAH